MRYQVRIGRAAQQAIDRLDRPQRERIVRAITALAVEPRPSGIKKLKSPDELLRQRVGDWRILYTVRDDLLLVLVVKVGHRREVYR